MQGASGIGKWYCYTSGTLAPIKFLWFTTHEVAVLNTEQLLAGTNARVNVYLYEKSLAESTAKSLHIAQPNFMFRLVPATDSESSLTFNKD